MSLWCGEAAAAVSLLVDAATIKSEKKPSYYCFMTSSAPLEC